jgi:NADH-quinone oxidoreductase subunit E
VSAQPHVKRSPEELLSAAVRAEIDRWVAKYPPDQKQSAIMAALRLAQDANGGWLTHELIEACADYLQMPPLAAMEVATFYSMYRHEPVGRHVIEVCSNISCLLCGCENILGHLEKKLGIQIGETTADGRFTLKEVECLGACVGAPMMQIGKHYYEQLTPAKVDEILAGLK